MDDWYGTMAWQHWTRRIFRTIGQARACRTCYARSHTPHIYAKIVAWTARGTAAATLHKHATGRNQTASLVVCCCCNSRIATRRCRYTILLCCHFKTTTTTTTTAAAAATHRVTNNMLCVFFFYSFHCLFIYISMNSRTARHTESSRMLFKLIDFPQFPAIHASRFKSLYFVRFCARLKRAIDRNYAYWIVCANACARDFFFLTHMNHGTFDGWSKNEMKKDK